MTHTADPTPPRPANEAERLAAVARFEGLSNRPTETLHQLCTLAEGLFGVGTAGVNLVGAEEVRLLTARHEAPTLVPRDKSFSGWVVAGEEVLVADASAADPRFARAFRETGQVGQKLGFYAAAPLTVEPGLNIGSFFLADRDRRPFGGADKAHLQRLAKLALNELERQRGVIELARREALLRQAAGLAKIGSWELDVASGRLTWSDEMYDIMQIVPTESEASVGAFLDAMVDPAERERAIHALSHVQEVQAENREIEMVRPDGSTLWVNLIVDAERVDGAVTRAYGSIQDVTALHESQAEVERLAYRDGLTGLPNRAMFNRRFQEAIAQAREAGGQVGLILLDLDHFKDVNDTLGHDAGDALLCSVAERMVKAYRQTDTVARLGGDEFAILLPGVRDMSDLVRPTEILMELLRHPVEHGGQVFTISASVGGAIFAGGDDDAQLFKNADIALYQAKAAGRNRLVTYEPRMRATVEGRIEMLRDVRQGISRGEFVLYYQPVVDIGPQTVSGFEALMRWHHPTRGVLPPAEFAEAFEDQDLAVVLCDATFDMAVRQMRAWIEQGLAFGRVAVNVSAAQFRAPDLAQKIEAKLHHWGVAADRLTIEVTENVYMGWGADVVGDTIRRLHSSGVLIALDDFGTGYASLANLKQFPIDRLKIDKSFVQNSDDQAIVSAVINLGSSLGMKVVAEGVEAADQLAFLAAHGCDQVQGHHYAKPMPAAEVPAFLTNFTGRSAADAA